MASVRVLLAPGDHALHLPWVKRTRSALAESGLDIGLLAELDSVVPAPRRSAEADSLHRDPEGGLDLLAHLVRDYWELGPRRTGPYSSAV